MILLGLLLSACGVDLRVAPGTEIFCAEQNDCPRGLTCNAEAARCVSDEVSGPLLVEGVAATSSFRVLVTFNKPLAEAVAGDSTHYAVSPGITVDGLRVSDDHKTVTLFTGEMKARPYVLRLTGLVDVFGYAMTDTSLEFSGIGNLVDPTPPQLLAPIDTTNLAGITSVELQWTPVRNAREYFIMVTLDAAMTVLHPSTPADGYFRTTEPVMELALTAEQAYFWHVTSDASLDHSTIGRFATVGQNVFVYCPPDVQDCVAGPLAPQWEAGTRDSPFYSPARAINASSRFGAGTVKVAGRGAGTYGGGLVLLGNVKVSGGWDPTFSTRDRNTYTTRLTGSTQVVQIIKPLDSTPKQPEDPPDDAVILEGLTIEAVTNAVTLVGCDHGVILRDNTVRAGVDALGIDSSETLGPIIEDCDIEGRVSVRANAAPTFRRDLFTPAAGAVGIAALDYEDGMRGSIERSFIEGAGIKGFVGALTADMRITDNVISTPRQHAIHITRLDEGMVFAANNLIISAEASAGDLSGIVIAGTGPTASPTRPRLLLVHNTMLVVSSGSRGFVVQSAGALVSVVNNLFGCLGSGNNAGLDFLSDTLDFAALQNNAFVGCAHAVRQSGETAGVVYDDDTALAALDTLGERSVHGNVVSSLRLVDALVDGGGSDANYLTIANGRQLDGNWRPRVDAAGTPNYAEQNKIAAGGKVTYNGDCGFQDAPLACGGVATDYANVPRGNPTGIGAYERGP